jgi:hypothetical protein
MPGTEPVMSSRHLAPAQGVPGSRSRRAGTLPRDGSAPPRAPGASPATTSFSRPSSSLRDLHPIVACERPGTVTTVLWSGPPSTGIASISSRGRGSDESGGRTCGSCLRGAGWRCGFQRRGSWTHPSPDASPRPRGEEPPAPRPALTSQRTCGVIQRPRTGGDRRYRPGLVVATHDPPPRSRLWTRPDRLPPRRRGWKVPSRRPLRRPVLAARPTDARVLLPVVDPCIMGEATEPCPGGSDRRRAGPWFPDHGDGSAALHRGHPRLRSGPADRLGRRECAACSSVATTRCHDSMTP